MYSDCAMLSLPHRCFRKRRRKRLNFHGCRLMINSEQLIPNFLQFEHFCLSCSIFFLIHILLICANFFKVLYHFSLGFRHPNAEKNLWSHFFENITIYCLSMIFTISIRNNENKNICGEFRTFFPHHHYRIFYCVHLEERHIDAVCLKHCFATKILSLYHNFNICAWWNLLRKH